MSARQPARPQERDPLQGDLRDALFRGDARRLETLSADLPITTSLGFRAAAAFLRGDRALADRLVDDAFGGELDARALPGRGRRDPPRCGAAGPILGLLLRARDLPAATVAARRCVAGERGGGFAGDARAFRTLLQYLELTGGSHRRIHVHQIAEEAPVWELLLTALNVALHFDRGYSRASWARRVAERANAWDQLGLTWLARQAAELARRLDPEVSGPLPSGVGAGDVGAAHDGALWLLLERTPEWKRTLRALEAASRVMAEQPRQHRRVTWHLDMTDGSFRRPALAEQLPARGWNEGRRLSLEELFAVHDTLPPEDQRVLACSREVDGRRELTPDAYEVLIGHPRVLDAAIGTRVDVVRGTCRVETEDDGDFVQVAVRPRGAALGINVAAEAGRRLVVYRVDENLARVLALLPSDLRVPRAHERDALRVLDGLAQHVEVQGPHLGVEREIVADVTPCLRIQPHAGGWAVQLGVRPFSRDGRFFVAGTGSAALALRSDGRRLRCLRDLELERARVDAIIAACPSLHRDAEADAEAASQGDAEDGWFLGEVGVLALLAELRAAELPCEIEWPESGALRLRGHVTSRSFHGRLRSEKGWYLATGGASLDDGTAIALRDLVIAPALAGGRFVRLPTGDFVEVEDRVRRTLTALALGAAVTEGGGLALHRGALATLRELDAEGSGVEIDEAAAGWLAQAQGQDGDEERPPRDLRAELRPYQVEGYRWLHRLTSLGLGACLADDMGLGKTVQILALLLARAADGPALVVAPTSVCTGWVREMARFAPSLIAVEDRGASPAAIAAAAPGTVVVCSYGVLQQDVARLAEVEWGTVVLDEAQLIKNPLSLRARAACRLRAARRVAATGTPIENHGGDLWSLFHFLNPGLLGSWADFDRRFVKPIERDGSTLHRSLLREAVRPFLLRRLKREVLAELPPTTEVVLEVEMSRDEKARHTFLRREIRQKLRGDGVGQRNRVEVLAEITRLRRFCCHPRLVFPDADQASSKVQAFLDLVEELRENDHRCLVFSQWVDFLTILRAELDERGIRHEYLDGATSRADRQARVDAFQAGSAPLFLISLKAGGFGLNLTAADYVIHLDPWWNPAVEAQATDRAHRIGQERRVTVYRLVTRDSIEEKIVALHARKRELAQALLDGDGDGGSGRLSADELTALIDPAGALDAPP